jgi:hypothetical protein
MRKSPGLGYGPDPFFNSIYLMLRSVSKILGFLFLIGISSDADIIDGLNVSVVDKRDKPNTVEVIALLRRTDDCLDISC